MTDIELLTSMLLRANINFRVDSEHGWAKRVVLEGDRCFVFAPDNSLAGVRSEDDCASFDGDES